MRTELSLPPAQAQTAKPPAMLRGYRFAPLIALYGLVCLFFVVVWVSGSKDSPLNLATAVVYLTIRLLGVTVGVRKLQRAGFRANRPAHWMLRTFCVAILLDAIGAVIWLGYNLRGVLVPYPSLADIGYGGDTILWTVGLFLLYSTLDTTPGEELSPFASLLTAAWSLTVVIIGLISGSTWVAELPKVVMDIFYPFVWALNCAVAGSILFGPQHKRLQGNWHWFVVLAYAGSLITFLTNLAYVVTAACPPTSPAAKYLYYNGGPLDFLFATGDFLMMLAVVVLPLDGPLRSVGAVTGEPVEQQLPAAGTGAASIAADAQAASVGGVYGRLVEALEDEVRFLRHEVEAQTQELRERDGVIEALLPRALTRGRPIAAAPAGQQRPQRCADPSVCSEGMHSRGGVVTW